jgi:drug/metabolite transporter (DMT)-like permease
VPSALGFVLWGYAMANLPVANATALLYLVPPVAVLIALVWLGEVPHAGELLGGLVVISGVVLVTQGDRLRGHLRARPARPADEPTGPVLSTHRQAPEGL